MTKHWRGLMLTTCLCVCNEKVLPNTSLEEDVTVGGFYQVRFFLSSLSFSRLLCQSFLLPPPLVRLQDFRRLPVPHFEQARYQVKGFNPQTGEFSEPPAPIWVDTTIPHLIYHETSAESVVEMKHLLGAGLVDPALCCVLVDSFEEFELLEDMVEVRNGCQLDSMWIVTSVKLRMFSTWACCFRTSTPLLKV